MANNDHTTTSVTILKSPVRSARRDVLALVPGAVAAAMAAWEATRVSAARHVPLGGGAAVILAAPALAGQAHPDAAILALVAKITRENDDCDALHDAVEMLPTDDPRSVEAWKGIYAAGDRHRADVATLSALPCRTRDGLRAKAELMMVNVEGEGADPLMRSICQDLMASAYA